MLGSETLPQGQKPGFLLKYWYFHDNVSSETGFLTTVVRASCPLDSSNSQQLTVNSHSQQLTVNSQQTTTLKLDHFAHLKSPIHQWEQRSKLVGLLSLIFVFAFIKTLHLLPVMLGITVFLYLLSRLPFYFWLNRLRYPGLFIAAVVLFLPFVAGKTVLWEYSILQLKLEGIQAVLLIVTRFLCILTVSLVLFATAPFTTSLQSMRSLGLPPELVDMALLAYRYLEELSHTKTRMQRAMQLRGFQKTRFNRRQLQVFAGLTGSLLIRSYDRSKRVYQAMILRGYGQRKHPDLKPKCDRTSQILTGLTLAIAGGLLILEYFILN